MVDCPKQGVNKFPTYVEEHGFVNRATRLQAWPEGLLGVCTACHLFIDLRAAHSVFSAKESELEPGSDRIPDICNRRSWCLKRINCLIKMTFDLTFVDHLLRIKQTILSFMLEVLIFKKIQFLFPQRDHISTC